jgi:hypothetical protein
MASPSPPPASTLRAALGYPFGTAAPERPPSAPAASLSVPGSRRRCGRRRAAAYARRQRRSGWIGSHRPNLMVIRRGVIADPPRGLRCRGSRAFAGGLIPRHDITARVAAHAVPTPVAVVPQVSHGSSHRSVTGLRRGLICGLTCAATSRTRSPPCASTPLPRASLRSQTSLSTQPPSRRLQRGAASRAARRRFTHCLPLQRLRDR